jgi:carbon-monoxide dehydrogenase large subunit
MTQAPARPASLVGARVRRTNDPRLLRGDGRFVDDIHLDGMLHAHIVRSPIAHGRLTRFGVADTDADLVLGPEEIIAATSGLSCVWLTPDQKQLNVPITDTHVRYVGQPLGVVVASSRAAAEDVAEWIDLEIDELPPVSDAEAALADDAPLLYPEWGTNVIATLEMGDGGTDHLEEVFASCAHVVERRLYVPRIAPNPMETRGVVASWDPAVQELTVWSSTQTPHHVRDELAKSLRLRTDQVRVITPDLGGGFGSKEHLYPDEVIVCLASMRLGRPVKWIEDRVEHFTATVHARDVVHYARIGFEDDGTLVALHARTIGNLGAHASNVGTGPLRVTGQMLQGPYRLKAAGSSILGVATTTTPTGAYRGFGMQEAAWVRERMVDEAARELGMDPAELRRMNMYREDELPVVTRTFQEYETGDYAQSLDIVVESVREMTKETPDRGPRVRHGVGYATHVEFTGLGPSPIQKVVGFHIGGFETAEVRVEMDGSVVVRSGVTSMGQGIETTLAQIAADKLGIGLEKVRVELGDTKTAPYSGSGSIASRSMTVGGGATVVASDELAAKMRRIAAHQLEAAPEDIEIVDGAFRVAGSGDGAPTLAFEKVASDAWLGWDLPEGESPGLEAKFVHDPTNIAYSYATHAAEVTVDLDTGKVDVHNYWVCHDAGTVINPTIVDGQVMGGVAQGIGMALHEKVAYGDGAQPTTTSFLDYLLPLTGDVPDLTLFHTEHPSPHTPGGMKGAGEGGLIPAPAAIANAVANAVPEIAGEIVETPLSPHAVWELVHRAGLHDRDPEES